MLKKIIIPVIAILSIASAATADAKPKHRGQNRAQTALATVVCDLHGCSDRVFAARAEASARKSTVRKAAVKVTRVDQRRGQVRVSQAVVTCDQRGCSDRPAMNDAAARVSVAATVAPRQARGRVRVSHAQVVCGLHGCSDRVSAAEAAPAVDANGNIEVSVIGGRPPGCPRAFCGCEASRYVFGEIRPELNLAFNWVRKFPRTQPAPGMVAARSGHVMVLMSHVGGNEWLVHDGNSGGGRTREHVRSIGGYVIVDPRGARTAQQ